MAPPSKVAETKEPGDKVEVQATKKIGFNKEVNYDNMAGSLINQGADRRIYESMTDDQSPEKLKDLYDEFAKEYDGAYSAMLYESPKNVARTLFDMLGMEKMKKAKILDAGCGTGMNGVEIRKLIKETVIHGVDLSPGMLGVAAKTGAYSFLDEANLMTPLKLPTEAFDSVVSTGVFTAGHVKKEALRELSRVTKAGGFIVIACQELVFEREGYIPFLELLKNQGVAQLHEVRRSFTMKKAGTECNILVIKVL